MNLYVRGIAVLSLVALASVIATSSAMAAPKPAPKLRVATKAFKVVVPASEAVQGYFDYDQRTSTPCRSAERAIAPGIVTSSHYLAGHSFGPAAVSAFLVGAPGTATAKLQALCVTGGKVIGRRVEAKLVPGIAGTGYGRATATFACPVGTVGLAAPLSQEFAPGMGSFTSIPDGPRGWRVVADRVPDQLAAAKVVPAYADGVCVKAASVLRKIVKGTLDASGLATLQAPCAAGRRALGWGVALGAWTSRTPSGGAWATPIVRTASFSTSGTAMSFTFAVPSVNLTSTVAGTPVEAHVVCGKLVA